MNISGLGPSIVEKLFAANLVKDVADIYRLTVEDFLLLDGIKEKSAQKLYQAIQASRVMLEARQVSYSYNISIQSSHLHKQILKK